MQRTEEINPQNSWTTFKNHINKVAKEVAKTHLCKINQQIRALMKDLRIIVNQPDIDASEDTRLNEIILENEINHLQKKRCKKLSLNAQAQWASHGETISKYWSKINRTPRDIIYRLNIPNTRRYTTKSEEMAEITKMYHDEIQTRDTTMKKAPKLEQERRC
jgi:hypothetical protein